MLTGKKKKSKVGQSIKSMGSSENQNKSSKGRIEIITLGLDLEDDIIKTKQNIIQHHLKKTKLIEGVHTLPLNFRQIYNPIKRKFKYQIRNPHHMHVYNLKTLMRYNPYSHVVDYVLLVDPIQVPKKEVFDKS